MINIEIPDTIIEECGPVKYPPPPIHTHFPFFPPDLGWALTMGGWESGNLRLLDWSSTSNRSGKKTTDDFTPLFFGVSLNRQAAPLLMAA